MTYDIHLVRRSRGALAFAALAALVIAGLTQATPIHAATPVLAVR